MPDTITYLFTGTIVIGILVSIYAFYSLRHATSVTKAAVKARTMAILLMAIGFIVHTSGDYFGTLYGNPDIEHNLESVAHVILFVAFFVFLAAARKMLKTSKEYGFK